MSPFSMGYTLLNWLIADFYLASNCILTFSVTILNISTLFTSSSMRFLLFSALTGDSLVLYRGKRGGGPRLPPRLWPPPPWEKGALPAVPPPIFDEKGKAPVMFERAGGSEARGSVR